jgi:hypothetical protein
MLSQALAPIAGSTLRFNRRVFEFRISMASLFSPRVGKTFPRPPLEVVV